MTKSHMQMLRELLAKEEKRAEDEAGIIRLQIKDGNFTVGNEHVTAFGSTFWDRYNADTLEHAIEKAYAALVAGGE